MADDNHFSKLDRGGALHIAYLGSVTHGADRVFVGAVLERVLESHRNVAVTMIARGKLGMSIDGHRACACAGRCPGPFTAPAMRGCGFIWRSIRCSTRRSTGAAREQ